MSQGTKNKEPVKISLAGIKLIKKPAESFLVKTEEFLKDHYDGTYKHTSDNLITLMELRISTQILVTYLQDLCDQAEEADVSHLFLNPQEVRMIASLSKGLSSAVYVQLGNTNLRAH